MSRWATLQVCLGLSSLALAFSLGTPPRALAHPLAPASWIFTQLADGELEATWRTTTTRPRGERLVPTLPEGCALVPGSESEAVEADAIIRRSRVDCGGGPLAGLAGRTLAIGGLEQTEANVFVELQLTDGQRFSDLLHARRTSVRFTESHGGASPTPPAFLRLGVEHLLSGVDHVLFVLGLVLLVARLKDLLWLVSAFTLGHSVSLALSATGVLTLPSAPVELVIALSLLWLALEVLKRWRAQRRPVDGAAPPDTGAAPPALQLRRAIAVCAGFGLLHGLGFASAFAETGAAGDGLPSALFAFNVGVELGQLLIVIPSAALLGLLRGRESLQAWPPRVMWAGAYVIGCASAFYALERVPPVIALCLQALS